MHPVRKEEFSSVFEVGEVVESGAGSHRKNAAHLKILAIEDDFVRYQSLLSSSKSRMKYAYLKLLLDGYKDLDPRSIQKSVNAVLKKGGFKSDYSTENYAYSFAKAFHDRTASQLFLSQGEIEATNPPDLDDGRYMEGRRVAILVERIERDTKARRRCIDHFGASCQVCGFDFEDHYGLLGKGFIHVHHHRQQLASTRGRHEIDPVKDLIPLCPNCHAMIHSQKQMLSVEELRHIFVR